MYWVKHKTYRVYMYSHDVPLGLTFVAVYIVSLRLGPVRQSAPARQVLSAAAGAAASFAALHTAHLSRIRGEYK